MKKILLDTNAYTRFCLGDEKIYQEIVTSDLIYFSIIVKAELITGFMRGSREETNRQILQKFLSKPTVVIHEITEQTVEYFARIKTDLMASGNPIPINDLWIAAEAMETNAKLITYDDHFSKITNLDVKLF